MTRRPMMLRLLGGCLLVLTSCGGGGLSVAEFATEGERLVADMNAGFAALDASWEAQTPTREGAIAYWEGRMEIRRTFLDGIKDLNPPREVEDMHATSIDLFTGINEADEALAIRVESLETVTGHWDWDETPEGRVSKEITAEIFEFCRYSQGQFDATQSRGVLVDVPWVPSDVTEVISVAFGCPPP